jgi:hypothetical protein
MPPSETTEDSAARDTERVSRICANCSAHFGARSATPIRARHLHALLRERVPRTLPPANGYAPLGHGERLVFQSHTKEAHDQASEWIAQHGIFGETGMLLGPSNLAATGRIGIGRAQSIAEKEIGPSRVPIEDRKIGTASKVKMPDFHAARGFVCRRRRFGVLASAFWILASRIRRRAFRRPRSVAARVTASAYS